MKGRSILFSELLTVVAVIVLCWAVAGCHTQGCSNVQGLHHVVRLDARNQPGAFKLKAALHEPALAIHDLNLVAADPAPYANQGKRQDCQRQGRVCGQHLIARIVVFVLGVVAGLAMFWTGGARLAESHAGGVALMLVGLILGESSLLFFIVGGCW